MRIMQGDEYAIPFEIEDVQGTEVSIEQVESVEFVVGSLNKTYPNEVTYADGKYLFPITQNESFKLKNTVPVQIRVKFVNGDVVGTHLQGISIAESTSKRVL